MIRQYKVSSNAPDFVEKYLWSSFYVVELVKTIPDGYTVDIEYEDRPILSGVIGQMTLPTIETLYQAVAVHPTVLPVVTDEPSQISGQEGAVQGTK